MRLLALFPLLLLLLYTQVTAAKIGGPTCIKVVTALVSRPSEIFQHFQREICDRGCQPTIPHWDLWARNNTFVPAVQSLMKRLNIPRQEEALIKLGDDAAEIIKTRCGPALEGNHICADAETLSGFGNCFKRNFIRSAVMNLPVLLPMASEEACREQYEFVKNDQLWNEIIPGNMRDYAADCKKLVGRGNLGVQILGDFSF